jgi:hypothetical protein
MALQIESYANSGKLHLIRPVLSRWIDVLNRYIEVCEGDDCQWWYTERAILSSFAAAVWLCEGVALEEYNAEKKNKGAKWKGRCDLFFSLRDRFFACEAKQVWCKGEIFESGALTIDNSLRDAQADAQCLYKREGTRLGICFVIPHFAADQDSCSQLLMRWLGQFKSVNADARAWAFPEGARSLKSSYDGRFYPGVALFIRKVD